MTATLHNMAGIPYTTGMDNKGTAAQFPTPEQRLRKIRAAFVKDALGNDRWSVRKAAGELDISHTALGDRLNGEVSFLAEDIANIARLLGRDPADFFRDFLNQTEEGGHASLHLRVSQGNTWASHQKDARITPIRRRPHD